MQTISAAQLIFTNVEENQSPTQRRGFQVLFYTQSLLTEAETLAIERRLFYSPQETQTKWVFFPVTDDKIALGRIVPLAEPDKFGRKGRSFAHALIFHRQDFAALENNPFPILRGFPFMSSVQEAFDAGDKRTGNIPPANVPLPTQETQGAGLSDLPREVLRAFSLLAVVEQPLKELARSNAMHSYGGYQQQAQDIAARTIGCYGASEATFKTLEAVFACLPSPLRSGCSFDTLFQDGTLSQLPYWAIGLPGDAPRRRELWHFDTAKQLFESPVTITPSSTYGEWLLRSAGVAGSSAPAEKPSWHAAQTPQATEPLRPQGSAEENQAAYWLGEWFDGRSADWQQVANLDERLFGDFAALRPEALEMRVRDSLTEQVGSKVAGRLALAARAQVHNQGIAALETIRQGFDARQIREWMHQTYMAQGQSYESVSWDEWQEVAQFAIRHRDHPLHLVSLRWTQQWLELAEAIDYLKEDEFQSYARWALSTLKARVQWFIRADTNGLTFGPCIQGADPSADEEVANLLLALLGIYTRSTYEPSYGVPNSRGNPALRPALNTLKQFFRRDEEESFFSLPSAKVKRWLWLLQCLQEQSAPRF
jgi:hypothetical protein